jgi:ribosomal protein L37E
LRVNVEQPSSFEVYCQRCRVSFPVGTRTCIHCGERIGRPRALRPGPGAATQRRAPAGSPPDLDELEEEELPTRGGLMSPMAILWVVLILGGAIYRACS